MHPPPVDPAPSGSPWRELFAGVGGTAPLRGGGSAPAALLDNAASTPPLRRVRDAVHEFGDLYSSVHRGTGHTSRVATAAYEEARDTVGRLLGVDPAAQSVVFLRHTTDALNRVAAELGHRADSLVLTTVMEHHANLLPWQAHGRLVVTGVDAAGRVDLDALEAALRRHAGRIAVVAVSGASNVSGHTPPVHEIAALAHAHGALIAVDAAQLVPHRRVDVRPPGDPGHLDILAFSGHKLYAPYGAGVLVVPRDFFTGAPQILGGGAVEFVALDETLWSGMPEREEAGSPNVIGAVALAIGHQQLVEELGIDATDAHEVVLAERLRNALRDLEGIRILGDDPVVRDADRLGLVSFSVDGVAHGLAAAALAHEWGISVRSGCFCAHPYLMHLLGVSEKDADVMRDRVRSGDRSALPGAVRASFAPFSTADEVDRLVTAVATIRDHPPDGYVEDRHGHWSPVEGWPATGSIHDLGRG